MKKLILLLTAFTFVMTSCGNDDDNSDSSQDQLIGSWKFFKYFENGVEQSLDACEDEGTFVVLANGTFTVTESDEVTPGGNCEVDFTESGTWENLGSGTYSLTSGGFTDNEQVTFSGNTFYFEFTDDASTPNDTSDDIVIRDVYIKQ